MTNPTATVPTRVGPIGVGDDVTYLAFGGDPRRCRVTAVYDDVKNGEPGFDAILVDLYGQLRTTAWNGGRVWGYARQVVDKR